MGGPLYCLNYRDEKAVATVRTFKKNKGFTLIELVTVIVVLAIIGGFTFSFIDNAIRTYVLAREQSVIYYEGAHIMERIVRELSDATIVTVPASELPSSTLTFKKAHPPDADVTFEKEDGKLLRNGTPMGDNIDTFKVTQNGGIITVQLKLSNPKDTSIPPFELRTVVAPNNDKDRFNGDYEEI